MPFVLTFDYAFSVIQLIVRLLFRKVITYMYYVVDIVHKTVTMVKDGTDCSRHLLM